MMKIEDWFAVNETALSTMAPLDIVRAWDNYVRGVSEVKVQRTLAPAELAQLMQILDACEQAVSGVNPVFSWDPFERTDSTVDAALGLKTVSVRVPEGVHAALAEQAREQGLIFQAHVRNVLLDAAAEDDELTLADLRPGDIVVMALPEYEKVGEVKQDLTVVLDSRVVGMAAPLELFRRKA